VLEQVKSIAIEIQFDAFEFLDGNADAETLHDTSFGPSYANACRKVTAASMKVCGQQRQDQSHDDGKELAAIEMVSIRSLE
jgi:hypothetical protein